MYAKHILVEGVDYDLEYMDADQNNSKISIKVKGTYQQEKDTGNFTGEVIKKVKFPK